MSSRRSSNSPGRCLDAGLSDAEVVYTDCWPARANAQEREAVASRFLPYKITAEKLGRAAPGVLYLPCPPVTRGEEASADAMQLLGHHVYEAKEYLLHAQNAVLPTLVGHPASRGVSRPAPAPEPALVKPRTQR